MVSNFSFFSLLSIILAIICSRIFESEAIVKGENAQPGDFPSIVSLRNATRNHYCSGTLVTYKHIVTAAHCLYDDQTAFYDNGSEMMKAENIKVLVGTLSSNQDGDLYEVERFIQHPEFNISAVGIYVNDVAVVVLKHEVNTEKVVPTPISVALPKDDASGNAAGWGALSYNLNEDPVHQYDYPTSLQKLAMTIQDKLTCINKYRSREDLLFAVPQINTEYLICAQPVVDGAGMCVRDSGSPLMVDGEFVGHIVGGNPCGKGFPDLFASTAGHQDFINSAISS